MVARSPVTMNSENRWPRIRRQRRRIPAHRQGCTGLSASCRGPRSRRLCDRSVHGDGRLASTRDIVILESSSSACSIALLSTRRLKYKYKPRVIDGTPVEVVGVSTRIDFRTRRLISREALTDDPIADIPATTAAPVGAQLGSIVPCCAEFSPCRLPHNVPVTHLTDRACRVQQRHRATSKVIPTIRTHRLRPPQRGPGLVMDEGRHGVRSTEVHRARPADARPQ